MVNPAFEFFPGILEHVLVQEAVDRVIVNLNVAPPHRESTPAQVQGALRDLFGDGVQVEVRLADSLERGRTGKLRCIVSKVAA
jgi:hypothetical protein